LLKIEVFGAKLAVIKKPEKILAIGDATMLLRSTTRKCAGR
jgi:hypothetical protein